VEELEETLRRKRAAYSHARKTLEQVPTMLRVSVLSVCCHTGGTVIEFDVL
jgi:hypothetical protein